MGIDPTSTCEGSPCAFSGFADTPEPGTLNSERGRRFPERPPTGLCWTTMIPKAHVGLCVHGKHSGNRGHKVPIAHWADHKAHNNRCGKNSQWNLPRTSSEPPAHLDFTPAPANPAYIPSTFLKPTDFNGTLRAALLSRAYQLYGNVARLAPPPLVERTEANSQWHPDKFQWGDCVGTVDHVDAFLQYRKQRMGELIRGSAMWV